MVLIGNKCLTQGNSLVLCKANVIFCSKIQAVSRKINCRLADVQQAASASFQRGAELLLVPGRAQGVKKDTLRLAKGIHWIFCLSPYPTSTFLLKLTSVWVCTSLSSYVVRYTSAISVQLVMKLPVLWAVTAESCPLLGYVFRHYFQRWLYVPVDLNVAFFMWSHSDFSLLEYQVYWKA